MASVASSSEANAAASETEEVNPETEEKSREELVYTVENLEEASRTYVIQSQSIIIHCNPRIILKKIGQIRVELKICM